MFVSLPQLAKSPFRGERLARLNEKEAHGRAEPLTQGINRGHDGVAPTTKDGLAGESAAAGVDARRREVKAQPKAAAKSKKTAVKTPAKAKPAAKAAKPVPKAAAKKAPAKKIPVKTTKPAAKAAPKPAAKATKTAAKSA